MRYKYVKAGESEQYKLAGGELTSILATGLDTENRVSIFDSLLPKGNEAPWHYHEIDDEIFYVISGDIEFGVEQENFLASTGDLVVAGPKVKRRFKAMSDSHLLVINTPSGPSENFIRHLSTFSQGAAPSDKDRQLFIDKYKIHLL